MPSSFSLEKVDVALTPMQRFEEYLQSRGKRITQERRRIVEEVFSHHDHFDAEDLVEKLRPRDGGIKVSRPTVYRTLSALVEAGLLKKMILDGRSVYEHDYGYPQHDHLHCTKCGKLIEFQSEELQQLRDEVARLHQFRVMGHRLIVDGVCAECARPQRRNHRLDLV